jgi:hypothetical protein
MNTHPNIDNLLSNLKHSKNFIDLITSEILGVGWVGYVARAGK